LLGKYIFIFVSVPFKATMQFLAAACLGSFWLLLGVEATRLKRAKGLVVCSPGGAAPCQCNCAQSAATLPGMPGMMEAIGLAAAPQMVQAPQAPPPPLLALPPPPPPPPPAAPEGNLVQPLPQIAPLDLEDLPTMSPLPPAVLQPTEPPLPVLAVPTIPPTPTQAPFPYAEASAVLTVPAHPVAIPANGLQALNTLAGQAAHEGDVTPHYYQYIPGYGYFLMPGTPGDAAAGSAAAQGAAGANGAAAAAMLSAKGCACLKEWSLEGKECEDYCCNPDGSAGDWCFVEDENCEGDTWGVCQAPVAFVQITSKNISSSDLKVGAQKVARRSRNLRASFLQQQQDFEEGSECDCEA